MADSSESERIIDLEIRLAHQEHSIEELSDALAVQQQQMDRQQYNMDKLLEYVKELVSGSGSVVSQQDEPPPPHY